MINKILKSIIYLKLGSINNAYNQQMHLCVRVYDRYFSGCMDKFKLII